MVKKNLKCKSFPIEESKWLELEERKEDFLRILEVLNRYYSLNQPDNYPSESHKFREQLLKTPMKNFKVFIKQFGDFEYFIAVELKERENTRFDSWIHVDGIEEERKEFKLRGQSDHPVFHITSLTDLYKNHCRKIETQAEEIEAIFRR